MELIKTVEATLHIRKLRGGSQPILVRANDGFFYAVKFLNNLQGPHLLFNEAMGTELYRRAGLPVPQWRPIYLSKEFVDRNPGCWMQTESGSVRPRTGLCFGSRFLSLRNTRLFEILPGQSLCRIGNRRDFWTAWVLDVLCGHTDNRQALFLESSSRRIEAYFIDHGHLFGGAGGHASPSFQASRYLDKRIYAAPGARDAEDIFKAIKALDLAALSHVANRLPEEWRTEEAAAGFDLLLQRISDPVFVKDAVRLILSMIVPAKGRDDRQLEREDAGSKHTNLHPEISPSGDAGRGGSGHGAFVRHQRPRRSQALCASCARSADL